MFSDGKAHFFFKELTKITLKFDAITFKILFL